MSGLKIRENNLAEMVYYGVWLYFKRNIHVRDQRLCKYLNVQFQSLLN